MTTTNRLLRRKEVLAWTGMSNTTLQRLMMDGKFPRSIKIGERAVRWSEDEIREWIASRQRYGD